MRRGHGKGDVERRCMYCGQIKPKNKLIRVARLENGEFEVDPGLNKKGRGAYVCRNGECVTGLRRKRSLDRSFRTKVGTDTYISIESEITKSRLIEEP